METQRFPAERAEFYDAWLKIFGDVRAQAQSLSQRGYFVGEPDEGFPKVETLKAAATDAEWSRLMEHALCLACLHGNAFPDLVEQYASEAFVNLRQNGWPPIAALALPTIKENG